MPSVALRRALTALTTVGMVVTASWLAPPSVQAAVELPEIVPTDPVRLLETRSGPDETTVDGLFEGIGPIPAGGEVELLVAGRVGVPDDAHAVVLSLTAIAGDEPGYLAVYPCGTERPEASNINYIAGQIVANTVVAEIGAAGTVCVYSLAEVDAVADLAGWVPDTGSLNAIGPARLAETRPGEITVDGNSEGIGRVAAGSITKVQVAGRADVPADAQSAMLNVTAIQPGAPGFLQVYPCDPVRPQTSNVNYLAGQFIANLVFAELDANGDICIFSLAETDFVVDLAAFVPAGGALTTVPGARLLETRTGPGETTVDGLSEGDGRVAAGGIVELQVTDRAEVPTDAQAVILNLAAVFPDAPGYLQVYPCGTDRQETSNVNYLGGQVVANTAIAKVGADGKVCIFTLAETDIIADVSGYVPDPVEPPTTGTLTIALDAVPDDAQDVAFTTDIPGSTAFVLDDDSDATTPRQVTITAIDPGTYAVSGSIPTGWELTGSVCSDGSPVSAIVVAAGDDITCTFTMTRTTGTIEVVKMLDPTTDPGRFDLRIDGVTEAVDRSNGGSTGAVTVGTGTHTASEVAGTATDLADYDTTYSCVEDTNGASPITGSATTTADIPVEEGDEWVCTFTNSSNTPPTITSSASQTAPERQTSVATLTATDPEAPPQTLVWSKTGGGADQAAFLLSPAGVLTFAAAPDFENPTAANPPSNDYVVEVQVSDGVGGVATQTVTVTVTDVNDPPVVSASAGTTTFTEDGGPVVVDASLTVTDQDSPNLDRATVTIDTIANAGAEVLAATASGAIAAGDITYAAPTLTIDPAAPVPLADFEAVLRTVTYDNTSDAAGTTDRNIEFTVDDGTDSSDTAVKVVQIGALNDAPTLVAPGPYDSLGNVGIDVPASDGLLDGATITDPDAGTPYAIKTPYPTTTTEGGSLSIDADGSFTYSPPAGFSGADTFDYQVCDSGTGVPASQCSTAATVTIDVADMIWFIDNSLAAAGNGTLATPFNTLAAFDAINGNGGAGDPAAGDTIFLATGSSDYAGGVVLENDQTLVGQGSTDTLLASAGIAVGPTFGATLPATGGGSPTIANTGGDAVAVGTGNTIRGLDIGTTAVSAVAVSGSVVGTLTIDEVGVSGAGRLIDVATSGTLDVEFTGLASTSSSGPPAIDLNGVAGTFAVTGATTIGAATSGVEITNSPTATFTFASLDVAASGLAVSVDNAGTVNIGGVSGSITSTGGTALDLRSTTLDDGLGSGGVTLATVSSTNAGGDGINLDSVSGSLTVAGGAITNAAGIAVDINGQTGDFSFGGTIDNIVGRSVEVTNSGGATPNTIAFTGAIDDNGTGILLDNNDQISGARITFAGGVALDTAAVTAFRAVNGGTVEVTGGATNTIGATTPLSRTAVEIADTAIGASGVTFTSIDVDAGGTPGAVPAIILDDTGSGTFTVTGDNTTATSGGNDSGGVIRNLADADAIRLDNTDGAVVLRNMSIRDIGDMTGGFDTRSQHDAIHGQSVDGGLTLANVTIDNTSDMAVNGASFGDGIGATTWNGLTISDSVITDTNRFHVAGVLDDSDEGSVRINGITGTVSITASTIERGGELIDFIVTAGTLDMTVTGSSFDDAYQKYASGAVSSKGKMCIDVTVRGTADANVTIGSETAGPAGHQAGDDGNDFGNCRLASIRVGNDVGATGDIDVIVGNNTVTATDHNSGVGGDFDFAQSGIKLSTRGEDTATLDAVVTRNVLDEVTNADGGVGQLTLDLEDGVHQVRVDNNTFDTPGNAAWFLRADSSVQSTVLFENNTVLGGFFACADPSCAGGYVAPGLNNEAVVQNGGQLDLTVRDDTYAGHDTIFDPDQTIEVIVIDPGGGGGDALVSFTNVITEDGFGFREESGSIGLYSGTSATTTGTCTPASVAACQTVLADNGNQGGGGSSATSPPDVVVAGTPGTDSVSIATIAPSQPAGGIF